MEQVQSSSGRTGTRQAALREIRPRNIDAAALTRLRLLVQRALQQAAQDRQFFPGVALRDVYTRLFGTRRSFEEQRFFLLLAAPLARRIVFERAALQDPAGIKELAGNLAELEAVDPQYTRILDLHYFAALDPGDISCTLGISPQIVMLRLRLARAWLQLQAKRAAQGRGTVAASHGLTGTTAHSHGLEPVQAVERLRGGS